MKYKLGDKCIQTDLFTIEALKDIPRFGVKKGDKGGKIASEANLSQDGDAWVFGDAEVSSDARVFGDAQVFGDAVVYGYARVYGDAKVSGDAMVSGDAQVFGDAKVFGYANVYGYARVFGNARVYGYAKVYGNAKVYGDARVSKPEDLIAISMSPYNVTVTPQNIVIGCKLKSRFGKDQWTSKCKEATPELVVLYSKFIAEAKKHIKRRKS